MRLYEMDTIELHRIKLVVRLKLISPWFKLHADCK